MQEKQKTIKKKVSFSGVGLHTGNKVSICLKPAKENAGISFVRVDLPDKPVIFTDLEHISAETEVPRCTTIGRGEALIHTVEHFMSALFGAGIDNLTVEVRGNELPALDGSGVEYLRSIKKAGVVEQEADREFIQIREPISVNYNGSSIFVLPCNEFKISYVLDYNHPILQAQIFEATINVDSFENEIAPSRTFCLEEEVSDLRSQGLGQGANYDNTLVVGKKGIIKNEVRFANEFARHKVLDFIGDLYLLGKPIKGHVFAIKSGHSLNVALLKKIAQQQQKYEKKIFFPDRTLGDHTELDIHQIMKLLPHRYPFLLVDRVISLEKGKRAVGIKNVSINENYFCGHFPIRPIMPGVLMVEAMAQLGGIVVLTNEEHAGKLALFMAVDKVKFRKLVEPGEQLILEVEVIRDRARTAQLQGKAKIGDTVVAEAELMLSFTDESFLD